MTPRITTTGRDSFTPPAAMAPARRMHVHGPVEPMATEPAGRLGPWSYAGLVFIGMMLAIAFIG